MIIPISRQTPYCDIVDTDMVDMDMLLQEDRCGRRNKIVCVKGQDCWTLGCSPTQKRGTWWVVAISLSHCITVQRPQCSLFIIPPRVILGHTFFFALNYLDNPVWAMDKMNNSRSFEAILQGLFSVDSFFFLSGLLVAYIFTIKKDQIKDLGILFWCKFVLHRFLRLLPPYMALVGLSCWWRTEYCLTTKKGLIVLSCVHPKS